MRRRILIPRWWCKNQVRSYKIGSFDCYHQKPFNLDSKTRNKSRRAYFYGYMLNCSNNAVSLFPILHIDFFFISTRTRTYFILGFRLGL